MLAMMESEDDEDDEDMSEFSDESYPSSSLQSGIEGMYVINSNNPIKQPYHFIQNPNPNYYTYCM